MKGGVRGCAAVVDDSTWTLRIGIDMLESGSLEGRAVSMGGSCNARRRIFLGGAQAVQALVIDWQSGGIWKQLCAYRGAAGIPD